MTNISYNTKITLLLFLSLVFRLIVAIFYGETSLVNEWATLVHNFETSGTVGIFVILNEYNAIDKFATAEDEVLPSVFMPPLYFYFLILNKIIFQDYFNFINVIIFFQILLSKISIVLFLKIINFFGTNKNYNLLFTTIFALFPLYVYSNTQISSVTIQIFLLLGFFYFLLNFLKNNNKKSLFFFSIFSGLLILIRGEFYLFYILTLAYFFLYYSINFKALIISLVISLLTISPYLYRNYITLNSLTITKSIGFNLLKGNNPSLKVEGDVNYIIENFNTKNINIKTDNSYEIKLDNFYRDQAISFIKKNPFDYFQLYIKKMFSFIFFDMNSTYDNYFNIFHLIPKILISVFGTAGAILCLRKKGFIQFLAVYYFLNIMLFSVFFIIPRYNIFLLPINLIMIMEFINFLRRKFTD